MTMLGAPRPAGPRPRGASTCCPSRARRGRRRCGPSRRTRAGTRPARGALERELVLRRGHRRRRARRLRAASAGCRTRDVPATRRASRPGPAGDRAGRRRRRAAARRPTTTPRSDRPTALDAEQRCEEPLERFRVTLERRPARRTTTTSASAARRARRARRTSSSTSSGRPTATPYQWRWSTRYEIPCRVTGTVRVGDETVEFAGRGQRDHSWGARDWWAVGLDVERLAPRRRHAHHAVSRSRRCRGFGVGYVQRERRGDRDRPVAATEEVADDGLVDERPARDRAERSSQLEVEPLAFGALRLVAPDGRVSPLPARDVPGRRRRRAHRAAAGSSGTATSPPPAQSSADPTAGRDPERR